MWIKFVAVLSVILCVLNFSSLGYILPIPTAGFYGFWIFISLFFVKGLRFNILVLFFLFACLISIAFNIINPLFRSGYRLIALFILLFVIGPLNESEQSMNYRLCFFKFFTFCVILMSSFSFIVWFTKYPLFFHHNMLLKGLFQHSMILGPMSSFSAIICLQNVISSPTGKRRIFFLVLLITSVLSMLLAASRAAILSCLVGVCFLLLILYRQEKSKYILVFFRISLIIALTSPIWYEYTDNVIKKQERDLEAFGDYDTKNSRTDLWNDRIAEFKHSPWIGVGFGSVNQQISTHEKIKRGGTIEPGSSWLFVLSSIGVFGFFLFSLLFFIPIYKLICRRKIIKDSVFLSSNSILICFFVHMFFEGYILSSGSMLFLYLWTTIGVSQPYITRKKKLYSLSLFSENE